MSAEAARAPLSTADTRIHITRRTGRWDERAATVADARRRIRRRRNLI